MRLEIQKRLDAGIALIMVLLVILVLGIIAGGFAYSMKVETKLAQNGRWDQDMRWLGRSGVELARYVLAQELTIRDEPYTSLNQFWAGGLGDTNDVFSSLTLTNVHLGPGIFSVKITDAERKFNINVASRPILQQALTLVGLDISDSSTIIDSILDWRDPDDSARINGAESADYARMGASYGAKNGPIDDLSELLLVNGVTPDIYWGPDRNNPYQPAVAGPLPQIGYTDRLLTRPVGLVDLFCTVSSGRVNINTAPMEVLELLPHVDENIAFGIIQARAGPDGVDGTEDDIPFRSVMELQSRVPGMTPTFIRQLAPYLDTRSFTFEVEVDVQINQDKRRFKALVRRNSPQSVPLLNFYSD